MARMRFVVLVLAGVMSLSVFTWSYGAAGEACGREFFFYSGHGKVSLTLSKELIVVKFTEGTSESAAKALAVGEHNLVGLHRNLTYQPGLFLFKLRKGLDENGVLETLARLEGKEHVVYANPVFGEEGKDLTILTDEFLVRFKENVARENVERLIRPLKGVELVKDEGWYNIYLFRVDKHVAGRDALQIANEYAGNPLVEWASPNPLITVTSDYWPTSNEYLEWQTSLEDHRDHDIDASTAWDLTTGSSNITIAIVDVGVELDHEDLAANMAAVNYDVTDDPQSPPGMPLMEPSGNYHGTAVAGIAGAVDNDKGIVGVAPGCTLLSVRYKAEGETGIPPSRVANAIITAVNAGTDVINCSFSSEVNYLVVKNAVAYAGNNGRGGNGSVVVCSMGNNGYSIRRYPAGYSLDYGHVIAVGATTAGGTWWSDLEVRDDVSNCGSHINVVAPGLGLLTTDLSGSYGGNPGGIWNPPLGDQEGDYISFAGTSAAAPVVSGVAALVLSAHAELSGAQVRQFIEDSAEDQIGNPNEDTPGWDQYYGYGRINGRKALLLADDDLYIDVPSDYSVIQAAINAAGSGQVVRVASGTYYESVDMKIGVDLVGIGLPSILDPGGMAVEFGWNVKDCKLEGVIARGFWDIQCAYLPDKSVRIVGNQATGDGTIFNGYQGITCYHASPWVKNNTVANNYGSGIVCWGSDTEPNIGYRARNLITNNYNGVVLIDGAHAWLSYQYGGQDLPGENSIYANAECDVIADSDCPDILAEGNWWGQDPPDASKIVHLNPARIIDYDPWLSEGIAKRVAGSIADAPGLREQWPFSGESFEDAIAALKAKVAEHSDSQEGQFALDQVLSLYKEIGRYEEALSYLEELASTYANSKLGGAAVARSIPYLVYQGKAKEAVERCKALQAQYSNTRLAEMALFEEGLLYSYVLRDRESANRIFEDFLELYPDDELMAEMAKLELGKGSVRDSQSKMSTEKARFGLSQNHPNPFNAQTVISFTLPKSAFVKLEVYNTLGQGVKTLVGTQMKAGKHSVIWKGKDDSGREVSSGIYFYCLKAGEKTLGVRKMLLLK